ncbi:WbqC family protein [Cognatitamlana onchidii]|uniref:WbqC family protein n=1 Tax=Cognatitamlana onchidii TaxID=2562860 RepID=UPI0010A62BB3|nr:WbqC family protein [Algibacter onchidii]
MDIVIHPTYFPSIAQFVTMVKAKTIWLETEDNFVKQTYRNRCYIYGANGKLALNIPVVHTQKNRQKYKDVKIFNEDSWQSNHWKSLLSAYRTSPFFEYYEDDLKPLFSSPTENLLDFNLKCFNTICDCLQVDFSIFKTITFQKETRDKSDFRFLVNAKKETEQTLSKYTQVFASKHGFLRNLSILDLLFNEGPNSINYLESQKLPTP